MPYFRDTAHFYETVGALMDRAKNDPHVGPKIAKSGLIIQFQYHKPEAVTTINAKDKPSQPGTFLDIIHGPTALKPDIEMSMEADTANLFWNKKINLAAAIAKGQIKIKGSLPKVLALLPAIEPLYAQYRALLKEKGYEDLIVK